MYYDTLQIMRNDHARYKLQPAGPYYLSHQHVEGDGGAQPVDGEVPELRRHKTVAQHRRKDLDRRRMPPSAWMNPAPGEQYYPLYEVTVQEFDPRQKQLDGIVMYDTEAARQHARARAGRRWVGPGDVHSSSDSDDTDQTVAAREAWAWDKE